MFYNEFSVKERQSIWAETSAGWNERNPNWKIVGNDSNGEHFIYSNGEESISQLRKLVLNSILDNERKEYSLQFESGRTGIAECNISYKIGTYVIVEADRGEDCCKIVEIREGNEIGWSRNANSFNSNINNFNNGNSFNNANNTNSNTYNNYNSFNTSNSFNNNSNNIYYNSTDVVKILRVATREDVNLLKIRSQQEEKALAKCIELVKEKKYPMEVIKCEFQWDMKKITFYFRSKQRIDFRELVKELFKHFKIRIWMSMETI